jgi:hypothetical protein
MEGKVMQVEGMEEIKNSYYNEVEIENTRNH